MTKTARPAAADPWSAAQGGAETVLSVRLRVRLPEAIWMASFTVAHPTVRLEVLDRLEVGRRLVLFEVRVVPDARARWAEEIRRIPGVREVEAIDAGAAAGIYRVLWSGRTFLPLVKRLRLPRHFPFPVESGVATWTVAGPETKVRELLRHLDRARIAWTLELVRRGPSLRLASTLTPRQREILHRAVSEGYFEVPRRISLTDLAPRIGVATSTLSVTLAVIEKKIVEAYSGSVGGDPHGIA
jgi:hypothetical protein